MLMQIAVLTSTSNKTPLELSTQRTVLGSTPAGNCGVQSRSMLNLLANGV